MCPFCEIVAGSRAAHIVLDDDVCLAFIRSVRALKPEDGGMVPAIAIGDGNANVERTRGRGFDAYVSTPLEGAKLCRVITNLLTG